MVATEVVRVRAMVRVNEDDKHMVLNTKIETVKIKYTVLNTFFILKVKPENPVLLPLCQETEVTSVFGR